MVSEHKLNSHVESAVKRREPGILKLAETYNGLCQQIVALIKQHRAPRNATAPEQIKRDGLFKLDVDDDIWQDVGLDDNITDTDDSSESAAVPRWLGDEKVREGIKAQLAFDRCMEEQERLSYERCTMQVWMQEEWKALEQAMANASVYFCS